MIENKKIYKIGSFGWLKEQAKKDGFDNIKDWQNRKSIYQIKNIDQVIRILEENNIKIKDVKIFHRFWDKVDIKDNNEECWNWNKCTDLRGYARIGINGKLIRINRMSYILTKGDITEGLNILHICNNPSCCNPNHLELGNSSKNNQYTVKCGRRNNYGKNNGNSVLIEDQVRDIHKLHKAHPELKNWQIAEMFDVNSGTIYCIINGKTWRNIYEECIKG